MSNTPLEDDPPPSDKWITVPGYMLLLGWCMVLAGAAVGAPFFIPGFGLLVLACPIALVSLFYVSPDRQGLAFALFVLSAIPVALAGWILYALRNFRIPGL